MVRRLAAVLRRARPLETKAGTPLPARTTFHLVVNGRRSQAERCFFNEGFLSNPDDVLEAPPVLKAISDSLGGE